MPLWKSGTDCDFLLLLHWTFTFISMCHTPRMGANIPTEDTHRSTFSDRYVNSLTNTDVHISILIHVHICASPHKHTPCIQACEYLCKYILIDTTKIYSINICTPLPNICILPPRHTHIRHTHLLTHTYTYICTPVYPTSTTFYSHTYTHAKINSPHIHIHIYTYANPSLRYSRALSSTHTTFFQTWSICTYIQTEIVRIQNLSSDSDSFSKRKI